MGGSEEEESSRVLSLFKKKNANYYIQDIKTKIHRYNVELIPNFEKENRYHHLIAPTNSLHLSKFICMFKLLILKASNSQDCISLLEKH